MKVTVYTHNDADGILSAYIVNASLKKDYGNDVEINFSFNNYGLPFDIHECDGSDEVIFTDFLPSNDEDLFEIIESHDEITIIDHHESKKQTIEKISKKYNNVTAIEKEQDGISAAMLCHRYFFENIDPHKLFTVLSNFDTFYMPNGKESFYNNEIPLMYGFMEYHNETPHIDSELASLFSLYFKGDNDATELMDKFYDLVIENGRMIFGHHQKCWEKQTIKSAFTARIFGKNAICMNSAEIGSMQFDNIIRSNQKFAKYISFAFYFKANGKWSVSLYANDSGVDVGNMAKRRFAPGGGHVGSAGGEYDGNIFNILKEKKPIFLS